MGHMISKTSFLAGCQCPKLLWKRFNEPDVFPPVDPGKQAIFDQGHSVGALAKTLYPGGIEVGDGVVHRTSVVEETTALLARRVPLYEPAFAAGEGYARIDILVPDPAGGPNAWRIVEVKSGSSVKDENLTDVAFQLHVCREAGLTITRCAVMHMTSAWHHPDQHGNASIKNVLPALTGTDYSHLGIQDGGAAARAFASAEFGSPPPEDRNKLRADLLAYCELDTRAMVDLVKALANLADGSRTA